MPSANHFTGTRVPITLEQYGATAGGRFIKDKFFWFFGYEDSTDTLGDSNTPTIPSDVACGGPSNSMVDACNDFVNVQHVAINPLSAQIAGLNPATCVVTPASPANENLFPFVDPRVTLNLGLRYEYNGPPVETLGNFQGNFYHG